MNISWIDILLSLLVGSGFIFMMFLFRNLPMDW